MSPEEELRRAERAKQILNDEIFSEAVQQIRDGLLLGLRNTAFKDVKLMEKLCQRYCVLEDMIGLLQSTMETGEFAKQEIERLSLIEKAKEFFN